MAESRLHARNLLLQQQLPHGVLECLCSLATPRQRAVLSLVCKEWRDAVLHSTVNLTANLKSDIGAAAISQWLQRHAGQLAALELSTVGLYGRHIHPPTRLQLFQALHVAAGSTAAELGAPAGHDHSQSEEEDYQQLDTGANAAAAAAAGAQGMDQQDQHAGSTAESAAPHPQAAAPAAPAACAIGTAAQASNQAPQGPAGIAQDMIHAALATGAQASAVAAAATTAASTVKPLRLTYLAANMRLAPADCAAIASLPAPRLAHLALLGSRTRRLALDGVGSLALMQQLTTLKVERLGIGDEATALLARNLTGLLQLSLSGNNIGPTGATAIARHLTILEYLDLSVNRIKDSGLSSLCASLHLLQFLSLSGNIKFAAATLQQLHSLQQLTQLLTSSNALGNQGLAALAAALPPSLRVLDAGNNKISKVDCITTLTGLTGLTLSRNPLQLSCTKVLATGLSQLEELVLFDAVSAKAVGALAGAAPSLTSLVLGCDPATTPDDATNLPLSKTRTCSALFTAFAEAGKLQALAAPCVGLCDAQAKLLVRFKGSALTALNLGYNSITPEGLKFLKDLPQLKRLEVRSMRPELSDAAARMLSGCSRLELLDIAFNDLSSEGLRQLGAGQMQRLQHLNLRNNVQIEKEAILAAGSGLSALTYLNLLELSDVTSNSGSRGAAGPGLSGRGGVQGSSSIGTGGAAAAGGAGVAHADIWAALPNLQELVVGAYTEGGSGFRTGRVMFSGAG